MDDLTFPNPGKSIAPIKLDMSEVNFAEGRVPEIAFVTPTKGPELMSVFSKACFVLGRHVANVYFHHRMAKKRLGDRAAILLIDVIPDKIKEKDLRDNEQVRQAFLDLDPEYSAAHVAEAQTEATLMLVERKLRDMEGALNAVKKAVDGQYGIFSRSNPTLQTGGIPSLDLEDQPIYSLGTSGPVEHTTTGRPNNGTPMKIGKPTY